MAAPALGPAPQDLVLEPGEEPHDLAVANRVGALDGRHPAAGAAVHGRLRDVLGPDGELWVDGVRTDLPEPLTPPARATTPRPGH